MYLHVRRKFHLRRKKGLLPFRYVLLISFLIFILLTYFGLWIIESNIRPTLLDIAQLETEKIATSAINYAVSNTVKNVNMNELIVIKKEDQDKTSSIGFDADVYNQVVSQSVLNAQKYLKFLEEGKLHELEMLDLEKQIKNTDKPGVIYNIPLGIATKNALLGELGPLVPVKFTTIGDVDVELNEKIEHIGINNAWIRVSMDLAVQTKVIIPFASSTTEVTTTVPIGMIYVQGEVPEFYSGKEGGLPHPAIKSK